MVLRLWLIGIHKGARAAALKRRNKTLQREFFAARSADCFLLTQKDHANRPARAFLEAAALA